MCHVTSGTETPPLRLGGSWARVPAMKRFLWLALLVVLVSVVPLHAQPKPYEGKTVRIVVGFSAGGGYDTYSRLIGRHLGRHLPGKPTVIVENMPGAGSIKSANHLFTAAPKDGTVIGTFGRGLPYTELVGDPAAQFKSAQFNWIGSMNDEVSICVLRSDALAFVVATFTGEALWSEAKRFIYDRCSLFNEWWPGFHDLPVLGQTAL